MADEEMDPTPGSDEQPPDLSSVLAKSVGSPASVPEHVKRKAKEKKPTESKDKFTKDSDTPVTREQYEKLMADRPIKFGPKMTGFVRDGGKKNGHKCYDCIHWFAAHASSQMTCEVVRVSDEDDVIHDDDTCNLWMDKDGNQPLFKEIEA